MKLYQAIAQNSRILESGNPAWIDAAEKRQKRINDLLPSGSGFDAGTEIVSANDMRIVFSTAYHHMDEFGYYNGWTEHKVIVKASLMHGFTIRVTGRNRNGIKGYIAEVFTSMLDDDFDWN